MVSVGKCSLPLALESWQIRGATTWKTGEKDMKKSNAIMKKFQNGGGRWGIPEKSFMCHAWGRSTDRIERWEKQSESGLLWAAIQTLLPLVPFTVETASRHSHFGFSQMCLRFLITVESVFERWSHWIYLYDYETTIAQWKLWLSVFPHPAPSGRRGAQAPFECVWLLPSAHLLLLTEICDESLLNNTEKRLRFHNPATHTEMKTLLRRYKRDAPSYVLYWLKLYYKYLTISGFSTWF